MRVLVTGGRDFQGKEAVYKALEAVNPTVIIQGGCPTGADKWARQWAEANEVDLITCYAKWKQHGKSAGPRRNKRMVQLFRPELGLAFPGGRGTLNCIQELKKAGIEARQIAA